MRLIFAFAMDVTKTVEELQVAKDNFFGKYRIMCAVDGQFSLLLRRKSSALAACCYYNYRKISYDQTE
jgi:hypothetical protein